MHARSEDEWFEYYLWQLGRRFEKHGQNAPTPSRLITIIDFWLRTGDVAAEDRGWSVKRVSYVKQVPADMNAFWITPGAMMTRLN